MKMRFDEFLIFRDFDECLILTSWITRVFDVHKNSGTFDSQPTDELFGLETVGAWNGCRESYVRLPSRG